MTDKKEAVSGAENTESGEANDSTFISLAEPDEKVKSVPPLDLYTAVFMLNAVREALDGHYLRDDDKYRILSLLVKKVQEANEA